MDSQGFPSAENRCRITPIPADTQQPPSPGPSHSLAGLPFATLLRRRPPPSPRPCRYSEVPGELFPALHSTPWPFTSPPTTSSAVLRGIVVVCSAFVLPRKDPLRKFRCRHQNVAEHEPNSRPPPQISNSFFVPLFLSSLFCFCGAPPKSSRQIRSRTLPGDEPWICSFFLNMS
jgi:hypothetical protein